MRACVSAACVVLVCLFAASCTMRPDVAKQRYLKSGDNYFAQKKYKEALIQYGNAIKQDPLFGLAHLHLAVAFTAVNDRRQAAMEYVRAADLLPDNDQAQIEAGRVLVNNGYYKEAIARARTVLKRNRNNVDALIVLGNALAGMKSYDDAAGVAEQAIRVDPERAGVYSTLGVFELAQGNADSAEAAFTKATALAPNSADAFLNLGNFYRAVRRLPDAERALKRAYALQPAWARVNQAMAALYVQWSRSADAEPYFKAVVEITKDSKARFDLADYYLRVGRFDEARAVLEAVAAEPADYAQANARIALLEFARGRRQQANEIIDEVLRKLPHDAEALTLKARLLLADRRPVEALERAKQAVMADQRSADAQLTLARIHMALNDPDEARKALNETLKLDPQSLPAELELSELHRSRNEIDSAIEFAQQAVSNHRESVPARLTLIRALLIRDDDYPHAEKELRDLLSQHPESATAHALMGTIWLTKKDLGAARQSFEHALALDHGSAEALTGLVVMDLDEKKPGAARKRIESYLAKVGDRPAPLLAATKLYSLIGDDSKVESTLKRALALDPGNPDIYDRLGRLYIGHHRAKEAKAQFASMAALDPRSIGATTMLGWLCYADKDYAEAQKWWDKTIQIDSGAAAAANNLAWMYAERNVNLDLALQLAQTARQAYPTLAQVNDTLGWVYYRKALDTQAIFYLQQSVEKEPTNPIYYYHLGLAYARKGEDANARRALQHALDLQSNFEGAVEARRVLETLIF